MNELNLTPTELKIFLTVIVFALVRLLRHKSYFQLDIEPKTDTVTDKPPHNVGTRYGAYIQSQGKYYN